MRVEDIAREDVVTVEPDTVVVQVARRMREDGVGSVVVERDRQPVGIVTDRDLTTRVLADGRDGTEVRANEVMTGDPATVRADDDAFAATVTLKREGVRRVPVTDKAGELVGIVSLDDLLAVVIGELRNIDDVVRSESPPR